MAFQVTPETDVAEAAMFHGAEIKLSANQAISTGSTTNVEYDEVVYDTDGFFDSASYGFVIPEGVRAVRVFASGFWAPNSTGRRILFIDLNGTEVAGVTTNPPSAGPHRMSAGPRIVPVSTGDVLTVDVFQDTGGNLDFREDGRFSFFGLEVIKTPLGRPDSPTLP